MKTSINKILAILIAFIFSFGMSAEAQRDNRSRGQQNTRSEVRSNRGGERQARKEHKAAPAPKHHAHKPAPAPKHHHKPAPKHHHAHKPAPKHHHVHKPAHHHVHKPAHHHVHRHVPPRPRYHRHIHHSARPFYINNVCYYHHNGVYYRPHPTYGYEVVTIPVNTYVHALPFHCERVVVGNVAYFHGEGMWFAPHHNGYMVVNEPVIVEAPAPAVVIEAPAPKVSIHASFEL
ncbi:MAG: hypothetical protein J6Q03_10365 [Paludibacteraceae bacterium]|nr:hypothetical protein [Paludibacteraceae bacterium]MBO5862875.1 hypothetical protein [Paludibacteraceae bacterium]MBO5989857.1 hypothetical protein [Paludibacteraceae bacterium]